MLELASETRPEWLAAATDAIPTLLLDHAHCEKKAASTAVNLIFRYPDRLGLVRTLSALAREELEHFERVLDLLEARRIPFGPLEPSPYAAGLMKAVRRGDPDRLVDTLLCCALIEARSCERMKLLSEGLPDASLRDFYAQLLASEARHFRTYVDLAAQEVGRDATVTRLRELAAHEAAVLTLDPEPLRMHSGSGT